MKRRFVMVGASRGEQLARIESEERGSFALVYWRAKDSRWSETIRHRERGDILREATARDLQRLGAYCDLGRRTPS